MEGVCKNTGKKEVKGMKEGELGRVYSNGDIIFEEGDKGDVMYVVQSGKVKISKNSSSGNITMATLQSGDIFGEMALFDSLPRSASAIAEDDARILSIDKKKLFSTIGKDPTVVLKVIIQCVNNMCVCSILHDYSYGWASCPPDGLNHQFTGRK
jgi:CRP-like cAMP-binding protein